MRSIVIAILMLVGIGFMIHDRDAHLGSMEGHRLKAYAHE